VSTVTFWFDPICPFTWRTSRWVRDIAQRRDLTVDWRVMSLGILNEGNEMPEEYKSVFDWSAGVLRVLVATGEAHGRDGVDRLYTALGERFHVKGETPGPDLLAGALADAGLPGELAARADDESLQDAVRTSHQAGQDRVGTESGSPIFAIGDGPGFFGPVVVPTPEDDAAERLFDAIALLSTVPQFSELKRSREAF
jgi:2-hydroxychromene-2-carboxylate isomerase